MSPSLAPDVLARLRRLDTCALSDALDRLSLPGVVGSVPCRTGWASLAGRATTVELAHVTDVGADVPKRHLCTAAVQASGPGDVIVVSHPGGPMAGWGGLLSLAASERAVEGTLVDGPCRDVDESRDLEYPVFASSATPVTARGRIVEKSCGEPVRFAGVDVAPGDLVRADGSGIVFVPAARAGEVVALADELAARESAMGAAVRAGQPITEVMGASYEALAGRGVTGA